MCWGRVDVFNSKKLSFQNKFLVTYKISAFTRYAPEPRVADESSSNQTNGWVQLRYFSNIF